jgi:hypothetical protein
MTTLFDKNNTHDTLEKRQLRYFDDYYKFKHNINFNLWFYDLIWRSGFGSMLEDSVHVHICMYFSWKLSTTIGFKPTLEVLCQVGLLYYY